MRLKIGVLHCLLLILALSLVLDILSLMSTVDAMIFSLMSIVYQLAEETNSMKIKAQKGKHSTKENKDQSSEARAHCTIYQLEEEMNNMKQFMIIVD
jgi:hypothetical protein